MVSVSYLSGSGSGSPKSLQTGCWLALHHLKAWLGVGSLPLLAWCTGWSLGVLSYFHVDLFPGYLSVLISVWLASPRVSDPREGKAVFHTFYNLALEVAHISSVLPYFIGHSDQPWCRDTVPRTHTMEKGYEAVSETDYHMNIWTSWDFTSEYGFLPSLEHANLAPLGLHLHLTINSCEVEVE